MYEYIIINEHEGEVLGYEASEQKAKERCEKEAVRYGSQRITVARRVATLESVRTWK